MAAAPVVIRAAETVELTAAPVLDEPTAADATPAELFHQHQRNLVRLAAIVSGDVDQAERVVRDAFVRLVLMRRPLDADVAVAMLRRAALAGPPPLVTGADDCVAHILALPRHQRDCVLLHSYLGVDPRSTVRTSRHAASVHLRRGLRSLRAAGYSEDACSVALRIAVADVEPADAGWLAVLARVERQRRRRRRLRMAAAAAVMAAGVALAAGSTPRVGARAERIQVLPDGPPLPTLGLPPMPPIALTLADGRIIRLDPTGTVAPMDLGTIGASAGPLAPGSVELSATSLELYAGRSAGAGTVVAFGGGWHGGVVAAGHSPAVSRDGRAAWIEADSAGRETVVVTRDGEPRRLAVAADRGGAPVHLRSLSWSPTGARLAVEADSIDGSRVRILDLSRDDGTVASEQIATARAPRWLSDGTLAVVDASGTFVRVIDPDSGASVARPIDGAPAVAVDTDGRGDLLVVHDDGTLTVGGRPLQSSVVAAVWQQ